MKRMQKNIFFGGGGCLGCLGRPTPSPGGCAGSENDTLLPMTMTCDRFKFWSGPAWRSKVIIRKLWWKLWFPQSPTDTPTHTATPQTVHLITNR